MNLSSFGQITREGRDRRVRRLLVRSPNVSDVTCRPRGLHVKGLLVHKCILWDFCLATVLAQFVFTFVLFF